MTSRLFHIPHRVNVWLAFTAGCLLIMGSSTLSTFNVYAVDLKVSFGYNQVQVEILAFAGNLGQCAALPTGILLEKLGARVALIGAAVIVVPPYLLLWHAQHMASYYHDNVGLIAFYILMIGVGSTIMYLSALTVNLYNFPRRHRGKVVGFLGVLFWAAPAALSVLYSGVASAYSVFRSNHAYFLLLGLFNLVITIFGMVFLRRADPADSEEALTEDSALVQGAQEAVLAEAVHVQEIENNVTGKALCSNLAFHLLSCTFILSTSVDLVFLSNQGFLLDFCEFTNEGVTSSIVGPLIAAVANAASGIFSDRFVHTIPRETFVVVCCMMQTVIMVLSYFQPCAGYSFYSCLIIGYISYGVNYTVIPTLVCSYFGLRHFSRNWGGITLVFGILVGVLLLAYGLAYETVLQDLSSWFCFNSSCSTTIFTAGTVLSIIALITSAVQLGLAIVSRKPDPEPEPPAPHPRPHINAIYGSQIIHDSFKIEQSESTISSSMRDWLLTSGAAE